MEFMGRLAALVPKPRVNLTRFHGVFSRGGLPPNSKLREYVAPQKPVEEQENSKPKAYSRPGPRSDGRNGSSACLVLMGPPSDREVRKVRVGQFESSSMRRTDRLKIQMLFPMRRTVQILKHLGLDQPADPPNRSRPKDLTDQQTTLF